MATNWPALLEQYERLRGWDDELQWRRFGAAVKDKLNRPLSESDVAWFAATLADDDRKYFVAFALKQGPNTAAVPLLEPLLRAAVYDTDLSFNRFFVEPCVRCVGWQRTTQGLLGFLASGSDFEKTGAVNALYHSIGYSDPVARDIEDAVPDPAESEGETPGETLRRLNAMMLEEFVRNPDLHVRRSICTRLHKPDDYPPQLRTLAEEARRIALAHPDEFIRERAEITYLPRPDSKVQFSALPRRERETHGDNEPQGEQDPSWQARLRPYSVGGPGGNAGSAVDPEEKQVLQLLVEGRSGKEIVAELAVSPETVRTHVKIILEKLQVHSRLEAATRALRDPPPLPPAASAALAVPIQQAEDVPTHVGKPLRRKSGSALPRSLIERESRPPGRPPELAVWPIAFARATG
jgi:DNA-binding CsgD family transcriptional regulator